MYFLIMFQYVCVQFLLCSFILILFPQNLMEKFWAHLRSDGSGSGPNVAGLSSLRMVSSASRIFLSLFSLFLFLLSLFLLPPFFF